MLIRSDFYVYYLSLKYNIEPDYMYLKENTIKISKLFLIFQYEENIYKIFNCSEKFLNVNRLDIVNNEEFEIN